MVSKTSSSRQQIWWQNKTSVLKENLINILSAKFAASNNIPWIKTNIRIRRNLVQKFNILLPGAYLETNVFLLCHTCWEILPKICCSSCSWCMIGTNDWHTICNIPESSDSKMKTSTGKIVLANQGVKKKPP